ncbi:unnamed protein product [Pneumocystis jirovecii]|uniref:Uncharacterized protein n=1 Tax=Pneumocystis jirovecii TaxID=42068 RepID=L0PB80_PNEJI|nr:unnamed protein product [Pneumocystis jirovecii]
MTRIQTENEHVYASISPVNSESSSILNRRHDYSNATHTLYNTIFSNTTEISHDATQVWSVTTAKSELSTTIEPKINVPSASTDSMEYSTRAVMPSFIISAISVLFDWRVMTIIIASLWIALCFSVQQEIYMVEKNDSEDTLNIYKTFWRNHRESRLSNQHAGNQHFFNP